MSADVIAGSLVRVPVRGYEGIGVALTQEGPVDKEAPGWVILSPGAVPDAWRSRARDVVLVPLTPAEMDELLSGAPVEQNIAPADLPLVRLVARGHSAAEIARSLNVTTRTVHRRVARLNDEFNVSTIQELATELARRGF